MSKSTAGKHGKIEEQMQGSGKRCSAAAAMWKGMKKLRKWAGMEVEACRIVNQTGKPVVVRAKYKDVWEGQQWRLAAEGGQMVVPSGLLKSAEPYCRLGAFLDSDPASFCCGRPVYITSRHVLASPRIILSLSSSPSPSPNLQLLSAAT